MSPQVRRTFRRPGDLIVEMPLITRRAWILVIEARPRDLVQVVRGINPISKRLVQLIDVPVLIDLAVDVEIPEVDEVLTSVVTTLCPPGHPLGDLLQLADPVVGRGAVDDVQDDERKKTSWRGWSSPRTRPGKLTPQHVGEKPVPPEPRRTRKRAPGRRRR
jgi:hypothetical protein